MAQRIVVQKTDDVDGSEAVETLTFALDGVNYEIDLSEANALALRETVAPWKSAGRRVGGRTVVKPTAAGPDYDPKAVRAWAAARKIEVPARGRVPNAVFEQYHAAGN